MIVYVKRYRCMHGKKGGHVMHAIHLADVVCGRLLPGSKRTPKIDNIPGGIRLPGCIDKPKA